MRDDRTGPNDEHVRQGAGRSDDQAHRPQSAAGGRVPRAVAGDVDRPSRQQGARRRRPGVKVGGHQASSASMVSIMTALYFEHLRGPDRVSVKPHASPVLHAIEYLLGTLDRALPDDAAGVRRAAELSEPAARIRSRPTSRPARSGSARRRRSGARSPTATSPGTSRCRGAAGRSRWSATPSSTRARAGRRSSTRSCRGWARCCGSSTSTASRSTGSCPDIAAGRLAAMFEAAGWQVITVKYGRRLQRALRARRRRGAAPAHRRDDQRGVPARCCARPPASCASGCPASAATRARAGAADRRARRRRAAERGPRPRRPRPRRCCSTRSRRPTRSIDRPSVIFAYTIKAWRLPTEGHPGQPLGAALRRRSGSSWPPTLGADADDPWARFADGLAGGRAVRARGAAAARASRWRPTPPPACRRPSAATHTGSVSTQQAFGRFFVDLAHAAPEVAARVVTVSPDVASSTNLGGWINRVGIWHLGERIDWFADDTDTLVRWRESRARPAHRARDRRGQPRRPARRARADVVARRPAAAADRHAL